MTVAMKLRLLCFPYAGASAMVYQRWRRKVPDWLEIRPVELPGRGSRLMESLSTDFYRLVRQLAEELVDDVEQPYALFGHSLGALLAFETAHALNGMGMPPALALLVSGTHAPSRRDNERFAGIEADQQLREELQRLNGTNADVLASDELMALTLPVLRADFKLCGNYRYQVRETLSQPLHVLAGRYDETTHETLLAWREETSAEFSLCYFDGDHFFIQSHEDELLNTICGHLQTHLPGFPLPVKGAQAFY